MIRELEPRRFRPGESPGRPLGGDVSPEPFPQALYNLVHSRGYESQRAFAHALGKNHALNISRWYRGENAPTPEELGKILVLLKPNDEELDTLIEPYGKLLQEGKGRKGGFITGSETARKVSIKSMRLPETPFEEWMQNFCREKELMIKELLGLLGINSYPSATEFGIRTYSEILQIAQSVPCLSDEDVNELAEAVAKTIQKRIEEGHKFTDNPSGKRIKQFQQKLQCTTYNGEEAGKKFGVSREAVRQRRAKLGLPLLLTEEHLELLRKRPPRTKRPSPELTSA